MLTFFSTYITFNQKNMESVCVWLQLNLAITLEDFDRSFAKCRDGRWLPWRPKLQGMAGSWWGKNVCVYFLGNELDLARISSLLSSSKQTFFEPNIPDFKGLLSFPNTATSIESPKCVCVCHVWWLWMASFTLHIIDNSVTDKSVTLCTYVDVCFLPVGHALTCKYITW